MSTAKERLTAISGHVNCNSKSYGSSSQTSPELESPQPLIKSPSSSPSSLSSHSIATNNSIQLEKSKPIPGKDTNENGSLPYKRHKLLKWNGWGYKDSGFTVDPNCHDITFTGDRYKIGNRKLPLFKKWVESTLSVDLSNKLTSQCQPDIENIAKPIINESFMKDVKFINIKTSFDPEDRLFRSHGHCLHEIFKLREKGTLERIPDLVVWPRNHDDVVKLVRVADKNDVVIIPYGGGTSVSGALECPINEKRMIVSLDTSKMNKILWIDHINLTAHAEAGIIGQDLEAQLAKYNLCTGHEPDSFEFSSLGGWVATRASGMKKNVYGNIEDLLIHVRMVSSIGTIEKNCNVPRISSGPDIHHIILGSEGTLGVITEVTLKVRPLPECKRYNSIVFPCFEDGYKFMREVARQRLKPASVRLMDNQQFIFGQALKPEADSIWISMKNFFKKLYITKLKGFRVDEMCVATILMEGTIEEVETLENKLLDISASNNGLAAGEENGKTGYMLTFVIAYIRDIGLDYGVVAESFETSVPWDRCLDVCNNVKDCITRQVKKYGIKKPALITCRITQTYDCGACVYFYFAFNYLEGVTGDPVDIYHAIENAARDEIIACGGSISHHHGVGKVRKKWLRETVSDTGLGVMKAIKNYVDPNNVFANGNLMS